MSFSKKIKEDVLVASARHCSVCHSYKGLKVEVHHINPKAQGGTDTENNAISLCFDCHADAGHYFADHPKGTKVSPTELRKHKKSWESLVKEHSIPMPKRDLVHIQHVITNSFDMIKELSEANLEHFPIKNSLLVPTPVLAFISKLIKNQEYRRSDYFAYIFTSGKEFLDMHPNATFTENNDIYNRYHNTRTPSISEIKEICSGDAITQYLLDNKCDLEKVCVALAHSDACGDTEIMESFIVRPLYLTMLTIENVSDEPISINSLIGHISDGILHDSSNKRTANSIPLSEMKIMPNKSLVVPTSVILSGFNDFEINDASTINRFNVHGEQRQEFQKVSFQVDHNNYEFIGPKLSIQHVKFESHIQDVHELDFNRLYYIDRYYMCGSCPHLFFIQKNDEIKYVRELFYRKPDEFQVEEIIVPKDTEALIIAELENELTFIESISRNKKISSVNEWLEKGMYKVIPVVGGEHLEIRGKYSFLGTSLVELPPSVKQRIIRKFIKDFKIHDVNTTTGKTY